MPREACRPRSRDRGARAGRRGPRGRPRAWSSRRRSPSTAGQWVSVPFGPKIVRAYSIASTPRSPSSITLCADVAPDGPARAGSGRSPRAVRSSSRAPSAASCGPHRAAAAAVRGRGDRHRPHPRHPASTSRRRGFEPAGTLVYWARDPGWLVYDAELPRAVPPAPGLLVSPRAARAARDLARRDGVCHEAVDRLVHRRRIAPWPTSPAARPRSSACGRC